MGLSRFSHIIFALGYGAAGATAVLVVSALRPHGDPLVPWLTGAVVVLAGGLVHEVVARIGAQRRALQRTTRQRDSYQELAEMVLKTRSEMRRMTAAINAVSPPQPAPAAAPTPTAPPPAGATTAGAAPHGTTPPSPPPAAPLPAPPPPSPAPPPPAAPLPSQAVPAAPAGDAEGPPLTLCEALAQDRVELHLQPVVALSRRRHRFFEALSRIRLMDGSLLQPDQYLPAARRHHLMGAIDAVIAARCLHLIHETEQRHHDVGFLWNVAAESLCDPAFMRHFLERCGTHAGVRHKLIPELSQAELSDLSPSLVAVLETLHAGGFAFSMDRVDTLALDVDGLVRLGVRYLKVPAPMLLAPARQGEVALLHQRFTIIAEKIESEDMVAGISDLGIPYGQGFLFSPVRPAAPPARVTPPPVQNHSGGAGTN